MHGFVAVLIGFGLLITIRLLALHPAIRRALSQLMRRLGLRILDWVSPTPEFDQVADDLSRALRRQRLRADVRRLERILATDMSMSATRQMGNRLAYAWLVRELEKDTRDRAYSFLDDPVDDWNDSGMPIRARDFARSQYAPRAPQVEILEIGWKH
jgi:hypothetical protein